MEEKVPQELMVFQPSILLPASEPHKGRHENKASPVFHVPGNRSEH